MAQLAGGHKLVRVVKGEREGHIRICRKRLLLRPSCMPSTSQAAARSFPPNRIAELIKQAEFRDIDLLVARNMARLARAFRALSVDHNATTQHTETVLDDIIAEFMGTEAAISRVQLLSGTHAITVGLFACLHPKDELLCVTGDPYDTLEEVLGVRGEVGIGSFADWGVTSRCHYGLFTPEGRVDPSSIADSVNVGRTRVCHIQRSCGYSLRPTLTIAEIRDIVNSIRAVDNSIIITVDNCYGEFTEALEPGHAGADLVLGSFIKNPGVRSTSLALLGVIYELFPFLSADRGSIPAGHSGDRLKVYSSAGGGYIAGRKDIVERARFHLGQQRGAHNSDACTQQLLQGLCMAPSSVGEALKGGRLLVQLAQDAGIRAIPLDSALTRPSFITALQLGSADAMVEFCQMVQVNSPVGSYVLPVGAATPGYESSVVFADGTFVNGCTAELSADGPLRHPYVVYCQGGAHWVQWLRIASFLPSHAVID